MESVEARATALDGREVFALRLYEPWPGAGRRVATFQAASVSGSNLASLSSVWVSDANAGDSPLMLVGETFMCTATPRPGSWSAVQSAGDVQLLVSAIHE
jgi:hypothetical protein